MNKIVKERLLKWLEKRTEIRNKGKLWKMTPPEDSQFNSYEQGYIDSLNATMDFVELISTPKPDYSKH